MSHNVSYATAMISKSFCFGILGFQALLLLKIKKYYYLNFFVKFKLVFILLVYLLNMN